MTHTRAPFTPTQYYLGLSLAFAAGVMIYVSFVEIFIKGLGEFEAYFNDQNGVDLNTVTVADYTPPSAAYYVTTATFFAGIVLTYILDHIIHRVYKWKERHEKRRLQKMRHGRYWQIFTSI